MAMWEACTVAVQSDVSNMQVVQKTKYVSVASQASPDMSSAGGCEDM